MEGHVKRVGILVVIGILVFLPLHAQAAGRWRLNLDNSRGGSIAGELVLDGQNASITGRLLLENRDSAWMPLRDPRVDAQGAIAFSVARESCSSSKGSWPATR